MRNAGLVLASLAACTSPRGTTPSPSPASAPAPALAPSSAPTAAAESAAPAASADRPAPKLGGILDAVPDLATLALFRDDDDWIIVSGVGDNAAQSASCLATAVETRCVEFAGYTREHLVDVLRKQKRPSIPAPAWVATALAAAKGTPDLMSIEVFLGDGGPVLVLGQLDGVRFAVRRDRRWRISADEYSGGKVRTPFYFGSLDATRATKFPSLGVVIGHYMKESCVRFEDDVLVVLQITDDALVEHGRVLVGQAAWIDTGNELPPFDPRDPNHYRVQLGPRVERDGRIRLEVEARHTPAALKRRRTVCGVELDLSTIDGLLRRVGTHALSDLVTNDADAEE